MSYEGYVQNICTSGHYFESSWAVAAVCPFCQAGSDWQNHVDETNCDGEGFIPHEEFKKVLISEEKGKTCNMGHYHVTHQAIYRRPKPKELTRTYRDMHGVLKVIL